MIKPCVFDVDGNLINIGEWDDLDGENPMPEGAYTENREVIQGEDGGLYLADYVPPETPQQKIERLENESALLALELVDTQFRLEQTEQEHAGLLLELVSKGVL